MRHFLRILGLIALFLVLVVAVARSGNRDLLVVLLSFSIAVPLVYLTVDRFAQKNQVLRLREQGLRAELALLKAQIDPHFFFNTLNNLYGLVLAKSEQAPDLILKLSDLMRFTIYEGRKDHVALADELDYLRNYLAIQQIRTRMEQVELRFETEVADASLQVPPLLLIMLVENAIKHGVGSLTEGAFVHISLKAGLDWLAFEVRNNYAPRPHYRRGIGLANLERRLQLVFPGRHRLERLDEGGIYTVRLRLEL